MAFINFSDTTLQSLGTQSASVAGAHALSTLEKRVVELAREDGIASLRPHRKRNWLMRLLLGPQPPSPVLANERLEALRRLAVRGWHEGYQLPASALKEAYVAGFTETQISAVVDMIARLQSPVRRLAA